MKKLFTSKTLYLCLLVAINVALIICVSVLTLGKVDQGKKFYPSFEDSVFTPTNMKRYRVSMDDFNDYIQLNAAVEEGDKIYSVYVVDQVNVKPGQKLKVGEQIGSRATESVLSEFSALCLTVDEDAEATIVKCYNYDNFKVAVPLSSNEYSLYKVHTREYVELYVNEVSFALTFSGYDFSAFEATQQVIALFETSGCTELVTKASPVIVRLIEKTYQDQFYIDSVAFDHQIVSRSFYLIKGKEVTQLYINCFAIIDSKSLIEAQGADLKIGDYLYIYA